MLLPVKIILYSISRTRIGVVFVLALTFVLSTSLMTDDVLDLYEFGWQTSKGRASSIGWNWIPLSMRSVCISDSDTVNERNSKVEKVEWQTWRNLVSSARN